MTQPETVLLVEDDGAFRRAIAEVLEREGYSVLTAPSGSQAIELLQSDAVDAVITDLVMPGMKGDHLIRLIAETFPEIPVIAITAFGSVDSAVELTREGASDYITKPFRTARLLSSLKNLLDESRARRAFVDARRRAADHLQDLMGRSPLMLELFDRIGRVAVSPAPVLIVGETGSGKELVARAVHQASMRDVFLPVNCGALPGNLLESELFGHTRGAFTGADRDKKGLFEAANGGTLFLDEIGEIPHSLQAKLLRAVDGNEIRRIGSTEETPVNVRIIAATNRDLREAVSQGEFREDLFWRLHVLRLKVPPLRSRVEDLPLLVEVFFRRLSERDDPTDWSIDAEALELLRAQEWPGNVRQLFGVLEHAATFSGGTIRREHLPLTSQAEGSRSRAADAADRSLTLAEFERRYIEEILQRTDGNKSRAARILGIPRRTLYRRLEEYGPDP